MSTTAVPDRFTTLPDEHALQATVVALEEHGFSVEVAGDLDAARQAVLARIPECSPVMTNASVTLDQTGIADAINDGGGRRPGQSDLPAAPRRPPVTLNAVPHDRQLALAPLDEKADHVRGLPAGRLIIEYGDYQCPYSRQAFHAIEQVEQQLGGNMRFAFRHFPLTAIHPHALAAAAAAEAAAVQGRFWDMHELLFHRQKALEDGDLRGYAAQLELEVALFDRDRSSTAVLERIQRDVDSGLASGQVLGTPTLFVDGVVHRGGYDPPALLAALAP
jgi:hypothetical protein